MSINEAKVEEKRLWLIDASYLFNAQASVAKGFQFDYLKLRTCLEEYGTIWRAYYLNSVRHHAGDEHHGDSSFHGWLQTAPPHGPKIITRIYGLKSLHTHSAYCHTCRENVKLHCPKHTVQNPHDHLTREHQKGVDVGLATLALTLQAQYTTLLLSSGDSDLLDAIDYLLDHGKNLELAVFNFGVSSEIQARADRIHWLDEYADRIAKIS